MKKYIAHVSPSLGRILCSAFLTLTLSAHAHPVLHTPEITKQPEQKQAWCILGNRDTAYALADACGKKTIPCTVMTRSTQRTQKFFKRHKSVVVTKGEATKKDDILRACQGCSYLYLGQTFPYDKNWSKNINAMVDAAIEVSKETGVIIIYPGRIYKYGTQTPIREDSREQPTSHHGHVFAQVERKLEACKHTNVMQEDLSAGFKARIIRHSYPYGPATGPLIADSVKGILQNRHRSWWQSAADFKWFGDTSKPVQLTSTENFASFVLTYTKSLCPTAFDSINYPGHTFSSIDAFAQIVFQQAQGEAGTVHVYTPFKLKIAAKMGDTSAQQALDVHDMFNGVLLDGGKQQKLFGNLTYLTPEEAVKNTITWYQQNH